MTERLDMRMLVACIEFTVEYRTFCIENQNSWWSQTDWLIWSAIGDVPPDGSPMPCDSDELMWFVSDWADRPERSMQQRIDDLLESRRA